MNISDSFPQSHPSRPDKKASISPEGIILGVDGKYRWVYETQRRKRPAVLFALTVLAGALSAAIGACFGPVSYLLSYWAIGGALLFLMVYAGDLLVNGKTYCTLYTMDETSINSQQVEGRLNKEAVVHAFLVWVGGQSQPALRFKDPYQLSFNCVKRIAADPKRNRIRMGGMLIRTEPQQFRVVLDHLTRHCPQAKVHQQSR